MKQVRDLRVGDILLFKNKESRIITNIDHRGKAYLANEKPRLDTYDASDPVKVWGTQEALF